MSKDQMKQLKKTSFLAAVTEAPMSREEFVDALEDFEFIGSYLDYLTDHFVATGKVVKNDDGTIQRKPAKGNAPKSIFCVVEDTDGNVSLVKKDNVGVVSDEDKENGWATTEGAAIKKKNSEIFAGYKEKSNAVKELADTEAVDVEIEIEESVDD